MPQLTVTPAKAIRMGIEQRLETLHTHMPGQIVKWSQRTGRANVQPLLMVHFKNQASATPLPVISNVPVEFPRSGTSYIKLPMAVGDLVTLHFAERSLDNWLQSGGLVMPTKLDKFALKDAIATPGVYPFNRPLAYRGADGSLELGNGPGFLEITAAGKFKLALGPNELLTILSALLTTLAGATVVDPSAGPLPFSPTVITALTNAKAQIEAMKG